MEATLLVRNLYEAYQERDWVRAASLLHQEAVLDMPATAERLIGRDAIISFQAAYPEPWGTMTVGRVLADAEGAAAEVAVVDPAGQRFALAAFWRAQEGLLGSGVEYWITIGAEDPPPSRLSSRDTQGAKRAWDGGVPPPDSARKATAGPG
jgi:ketosteroid isomerase-like protein